MHGHDFDAERGEFETEGVGDCGHGCFRAGVEAFGEGLLAKPILRRFCFRERLTHPRRIDTCRDRADIHNRAFGGNHEGRECLRDANRAPDVDVVHVFGRVDVEVQGWHDDGLAGVVDQVVERSTRLFLDLLDRCVRAGCRCGFLG